MKKIHILWLAILFLAECAPLSETTTQTPPVTRVPLTNTVQATSTGLLLTETPSPEPIEPIWTLPATLSVDDSLSKINELLQTNGNCRLPCWWNITPGQTKWEDARNILFPLIDSIFNYQIDDGEGEVGLFFPDLAHSASLVQDYRIKDNIIQEIAIRFNANPTEQEVKLPDLGPYSTSKGILAEYGVPDEIYIEGTYEPGVIRWQAFWFFLYYAKQRIFVEYHQGFQPNQPGPSLSICFSEIESAEIHVWALDYSFDQTRNLIFQQSGRSPRPLEEVTDLTIEQFYEKFTNPDKVPCFDTPAEGWLP